MSKKVKKCQATHNSHYWITTPESHSPVPLQCPVCNILFCGKDDTMSYRRVGCCKYCTDVFFYPNKERWTLGWRPSEDEIKEQTKKRRSIPSYIL